MHDKKWPSKLPKAKLQRQKCFGLTELNRRLEKKSTRKDFLSVVVENYEQGVIGSEEMTAHVSTLTYVLHLFVKSFIWFN